MQIETTHHIDAPPDAVWAVLGDGFASIADWAGSVLESSVDGPLAEGTTRVCLIQAKRPFELHERLLRFDREERSLAYRIVGGMPGMMKRVENAWSVEPSDGGTLVRSLVTLEVSWWATPLLPLLRSQFAKDMAGLTRQLEASVVGQGGSRAAS